MASISHRNGLRVARDVCCTMCILNSTPGLCWVYLSKHACFVDPVAATVVVLVKTNCACA